MIFIAITAAGIIGMLFSMAVWYLRKFTQGDSPASLADEPQAEVTLASKPASLPAVARSMTLRRGEMLGEPEGSEPAGTLTHFKQCLICGATIDCRDLGQVLEHTHGQDIEWRESAAPGA